MTASKGPTMLPVSEQMKAWSSALSAEVADWPGVNARSFFGFTALYRRDFMFAALPRTRSWGTGNCFAFKFENVSSNLLARLNKDVRVGSIESKSVRWFTFEISSDRDLHDAVDWLGRSYTAARQPRQPSPPSKGKKTSK